MGKINGLYIEKMNDENNDDFEPSDADLKKMMKEMHIKTEAEFKDKILDDWNVVTCCACGKDLKLEKAKFVNDAPYHKWCAEELGLI